MRSSHPLPAPCQGFARRASALDRRSAPRLALRVLGAVLARGRRTVTRGIRAAGLSDPFRPGSTAVAAAGTTAGMIAASLVLAVVTPLVGGAERLTRALDDTPTKRSGPHVQGAGVHHHPTPGPAGSPDVSGPVVVVLGLLVMHPAWGVIALPLVARALPLVARMEVRTTDRVGIDLTHRPEFRTKLELAVELLRWAKLGLGLLQKPLWAVGDGAYAQRPFLKEARAWDVTVVSRLRRDAALWRVPGPKPPGRRGPAPTSGDRRITPAKRAGPRRGWSTGVFDRDGGTAVKRSKMFLATWRPAEGLIRVVRVEESTGGVAFFCTDPEARVAAILSAVADRFTRETAFRDGTEVVGAGPQQVRLVGASLGAFHLCLWTDTMTESWAWTRAAEDLGDRSGSPWDDPARRPSHAEKRRAWRREVRGEDLRAVLRPGVTEAEFQAVAERLLSLAA
jgi:hypothetical protein